MALTDLYLQACAIEHPEAVASKADQASRQISCKNAAQAGKGLD
jgi:hypothetical protein